MSALIAVDRFIAPLAPAGAFAAAVAALLLVGLADYATGYEISFSLFYLVPISIATWYAGRWAGMAMAALSCVAWFGADMVASHPYSHMAIPVWNALVRFGFFAITSLLLGAYKDALGHQRALARSDALTGLAGRRAFEETLAHDLALARRRGTPVSIAFLDLDDFKAVNDTRGHAEGDRVLGAVGEVLKRCLREADTASRFGGDEFAMVLPDTDARGAAKITANVQREILRAFGKGGWPVGCSMGVVTMTVPGTAAHAAIDAADKAMYEAKRAGKGTIVCRVLGAGGG
jgi:diguanylate cyclase (GGDEF)-like protein